MHWSKLAQYEDTFEGPGVLVLETSPVLSTEQFKQSIQQAEANADEMVADDIVASAFGRF